MIYKKIRRSTCENFLKKNGKKFSSFILIFIVCHVTSSFFPQSVMADTVTSTNYSIDIGNIDVNPQPTPHPQILGAKTENKFTTGHNYTIDTNKGFFSLGLSQNEIDFGILSSTNPVIRTSSFSLVPPQNGAEILTYENHPLRSDTNDTIENTTCDNGMCSPSLASLWSNTLTYGFGYRCDSSQVNACDQQFSLTNYFKQYPNDSLNHQAQVIVSQTMQGVMTKATITNKINISGTQKTGGYYNSIVYLAIPNF